VSYSEGLLRVIKNDKEFRQIIKEESDIVLSDEDMMITLKNKILIPNAGIDNSNTPEDQVILWPKDPFLSARNIWNELKKEYKIENLGIIISDSHCNPLRRGTSGIAIGWAGLEGVEDVRGNKDLFDRSMKYTTIAIADNLASGANILMGETNASIPFVLVNEAPVVFTTKEQSADDYFVSPVDCIYHRFYHPDFLEKIK